MGRDIGSHSNRNAGCTIDKKVGISGGEHNRFLLCLIKVGHKVNRVFIDIGQHFHGYLAETGFRISHGSSAVSVHGTEVSMSVHQRITCGPLLGHVYQCPVNGAVAMGMVFTHGITHDTRAFTVRLIRTIVKFYHGVEYTPLYRF